jgi:hypothetical protein
MEKKTSYLKDIFNVGPLKPLGYLPLDTITDICGRDPADVQKELRARGLKTLRLTMTESNIWSGALYAWDESALHSHLQKNAATLAEAGWPVQTEAFVRHLRHLAPSGTKLFDLIADAFADRDNGWRSDKTKLPPGANLGLGIKTTSPRP